MALLVAAREGGTGLREHFFAARLAVGAAERSLFCLWASFASDRLLGRCVVCSQRFPLGFGPAGRRGDRLCKRDLVVAAMVLTSSVAALSAVVLTDRRGATSAEAPESARAPIASFMIHSLALRVDATHVSATQQSQGNWEIA